MPGVPAHEGLLTIAGTRALVVAGALAIDLWVWGGDTRLWSGAALPTWGLILGGAVLVSGYLILVVWRSPIPGYTALWVLAFGGLLVPALESLAGFLVALFLMARLTPRPTALMALVGSAVPIVVNTITGVSFHDATEFFTLINAGLWTVLMLAVWSAGLLAGRSERRLATERQWAHEARADTLALERLKISREVHDTVGHGLSGIVLRAAGARAGLARGTLAPADIDDALGAIQQASEQSLRELHVLLGMLRDSEKHAPASPGIDGIALLVDTARDSGLDVSLTQSGDPAELDPSIARAAYRVVQEALSNVMKHAGTGAVVKVHLDWTPAHLTLSVHNTAGAGHVGSTGTASGTPGTGGSGGYGLIGLRERLTLIAAALEAGPAENGDYLLRARLPLTLSLGSVPHTATTTGTETNPASSEEEQTP